MSLAFCQRAARAGLRLADRLSFLAPLATRLVIGLAFYHSGLGKLRNHAATADFFAGLGIPAAGLQAWFVGGLELVGGIALIAGLLTRSFALLLAATMGVALLTADREPLRLAWSEGTPTDVTAFTFLLFLVWLVLHGPGRLSLDAPLARRFGLAARDRS